MPQFKKVLTSLVCVFSVLAVSSSFSAANTLKSISKKTGPSYHCPQKLTSKLVHFYSKIRKKRCYIYAESTSDNAKPIKMHDYSPFGFGIAHCSNAKKLGNKTLDFTDSYMDVSGNIVCAYGVYNNAFIFGVRGRKDRTYQVNRHGNNLWSKDDYPSMCNSKVAKNCSFKVKYK